MWVSLWRTQIWPPERGWIGPLINQFYGFAFHSLFRSFLKKNIIWGADFPGKASTSPSPQDCGLAALSSSLWLWQGPTPLSRVLVGLFLCIKKSILWINPPFLLSSFLIKAAMCGAWFTLWRVKNSTPRLHLRLSTVSSALRFSRGRAALCNILPVLFALFHLFFNSIN